MDTSRYICTNVLHARQYDVSDESISISRNNFTVRDVAEIFDIDAPYVFQTVANRLNVSIDGRSVCLFEKLITHFTANENIQIDSMHLSRAG